MSGLKGKVAVVTGGSRGIGRAIVLALAKAGCSVAFNYHSSQDAADQLVKEVESLGARSSAAAVDVTDHVKVKAWIDSVIEQLGPIDILVNNAGILKDKALMMMSPDDWMSVLDANLNGVFHATKACIVGFMKQKAG